MAEVYQRPEPFNVPDGGLATFLTATEGSWAEDFEDKYPDVGIGAIKEAAIVLPSLVAMKMSIWFTQLKVKRLFQKRY